MANTFRNLYKKVANNGNSNDYQLAASVGVNGVALAVMGGASSSAAGSQGLVPKPSAGDQGKFLRGDGAWATPTDNNTWRGIQNNLTSDSTTDSLSAAQGKALKGSIDTINTNIANINKEAYITWGGKNFAADYSPIDAAMVPDLGANRFAFISASAITVEYSRDGGSTWTDYGASNSQKQQLFAQGTSLGIGKHDSTNKATANGTNYQLRVTIDTGTASVYSVLNKFVIYISTNGSSSCTVRIQKALQESPTTFVDHTSDISISGWSGYNVINVSAFTTYGNTASSQYGRVRFLFKANGGNTNYNGLNVCRIMAFGGVGWSTPSNMARINHLYSYDEGQNATFPAQITASRFNGQATKVRDSNNGNDITITYNKGGQSTTSWLASWNGYELGSISPKNLKSLIGGTVYWAESLPTGATDAGIGDFYLIP